MPGTAVLLAGSRPGGDPFAKANGAAVKALIPVAGVPMVCRPARALLDSRRFRSILVVAQDPAPLKAVLPRDPSLSTRPSLATIADTIAQYCNDPAIEWPLLVTTADHALLDRGMIDEFLDKSAGADLAIGMVEQATLTARFPRSKRTWLRFRGGAYSGANLFFLGGPAVLPAIRLWQSVEQDRKKVGKLLWGIGPLTFLGAALRLRTIDQVLDRTGRRLGLALRAVRLSDPLAAIDVDKQEDLQLAETLIGQRA